ncbi:electron transfer flavoprotein subunit alpha/FixB family protein [Flaviflexus huanghaiensis]|uniref:electron transfer flavoprotein subunit alpha/FixB family protein n=1 Tax=Flaviflexus huanghaiensis TaxID=1111473 RepID=UPI0015F78AE2|nr:electron transfer flavoprotein subunit alpha/FixB family protein [Flaviflexus huanghaiensis]
MAQIWLIAVNPDVANLLELAGDRPVTAVTVGADVPGAARQIVIPLAEGMPAEAAAPAVAEAVSAEPGDIVLVANRSAERVIAGAVAAKLNAPVLSGVKEIGEGTIRYGRYGGIVEETVSYESAVVAIADGGTAPEGEAPASETGPATTHAAVVTATSRAEGESVNLAAAKKIVAVGRGFKSEEDLKLADTFAKSIGAVIACSRPLSEGTEWLPRDRYIGITGQHVAPEVYVAIGISGQMQHTAGMVGSGTVISINSDDKAPMFAQSDYGVVGDLYEVLPAMTEALA